VPIATSSGYDSVSDGIAGSPDGEVLEDLRSALGEGRGLECRRWLTVQHLSAPNAGSVLRLGG